MKKTWAVMGTAVAVSAMIFTGCGSSNTTTGTDTTQELSLIHIYIDRVRRGHY